jgi:hypothetical protein
VNTSLINSNLNTLHFKDTLDYKAEAALHLHSSKDHKGRDTYLDTSQGEDNQSTEPHSIQG